MINVRFLLLAAEVAVFAPRGPLGRPRAVILGIGVGASALLPWLMADRYRDFSGRASAIVRLIEKTPLGSNTLFLHTPDPHRDFTDPRLSAEMSVWRELSNYPLVYRGGFSPYLYDDGFPVRRRKGLPAPRVESAALPRVRPNETHFDAETMGQGWNYFLARDDDHDLVADDLEVVAQEGRYRLNKNVRPPEPPPP
jgi:hypothetical protein